MKYLSVCSGIEAATVAWHPLGWEPTAFSEIDRFPTAVLAHHYPHVPNLGDMTKFKSWANATIDVLVGGTPCQSFSVAGLRKGLADPRGNLMLTYLAIAARYRPRWLVWENVPGVLSDRSGAFGALLGGMAELGYGFAYRVLDAQFVRVDGFARAVPQRRRRVFVVGCLGDWRSAAAVLLEPEGLRGDSAPRRQAQQNIATTLSARTQGGGGLGTDFDLEGGVAKALLAKPNDSCDPELQTYVAGTLMGEGFDAGSDGTNGMPIVPIPFDTTQITSKTNRSQPSSGDPCHALNAASHAPAIAFDCKASGRNGFAIGDISPTLRAMGHKDSHSNAGGQVAVVHPYTLAIRGRGDSHDLEFRQDGTANALLCPSGGRAGIGVGAIATSWAVRRLTPLECERLQGFPDGFTLIPYRKKLAADGPRYKALGNSMAVPVMRWIGMRIAAVESALEANVA